MKEKILIALVVNSGILFISGLILIKFIVADEVPLYKLIMSGIGFLGFLVIVALLIFRLKTIS